jgi:endonuclease/exonuclease/phosphatase family metal-dependent hydrolase
MLHVLGVHLKAFPEKTDVRLMQTDHLAERIDTYPDDLPVVVLGDFNSHTKGKNKKKRDDKFLILDILDEVGMDLVDLGERNTWTSKSNRAQLDQIYLSSDIRTLADARIDGPCNNDRNQDNAKDFENLEYYLKNVSDHCPVTLELEI